MACDRGILPLDKRRLAIFHVDRLFLSVGDVTLIFEFPQIKTACGEALKTDISFVIALFLRDGIMIAVVEDKRHSVDALISRARRLVDQDTADHLIGQHNGGALAVLDLEINGCTVKLVFGICHRFNGVVAAIFELCKCLTAL